MGERYARIVTFHGADLQFPAGSLDDVDQIETFGSVGPQGLFDQHMFVCLERLDSQGSVEGVGRGDGDRLHLLVREHLGEVGIQLLDARLATDLFEQILRPVAVARHVPTDSARSLGCVAI